MTDDAKQRMNDIAQAINERLPDGFGYLVLVWPMNDNGNYYRATNDLEKANEIFNRAGIGRTSRPPFEIK